MSHAKEVVRSMNLEKIIAHNRRVASII